MSAQVVIVAVACECTDTVLTDLRDVPYLCVIFIGPFNSWDRQVYIYDLPNGTATVIKQNDSINNNWILANYHSSMALGAYRYYLVSTQLFATM